MDLSELLAKLKDLSSDHAGGREGDDGLRIRDEDIARVAGLLGTSVSRILKLLGGDKTSFSKRLGENIRIDAKVSLGDARSGGSSATDARDEGSLGASNGPPGDGAKDPRKQRRRDSD